MKVLRVGLAQVRQTANLDENVESVFSFLDEAAKANVQILCFPETHVVGYRVDITPTDAAVEPDRLDEVNHMVAKRCGELGIACILGTETPLESDPIKGKPHNFAIRAGNAQTGPVTTYYNGIRPTESVLDPTISGYDPMRKEGAIILGTGGDNSIKGAGTFYEGAMTSGYPTDATENAVQANIVAAGYR